jgi:hypothetical protein
VKIGDNFLLEVNYAFLDKSGANRRDYFLVDVVDYAKLDGFLPLSITKSNMWRYSSRIDARKQ